MRRLAALAILCLAAPAAAQQPDRRGEVALAEPSYKGATANAPIPPEQHVRNEGGSNGAGLCVIASILANGRYQGVPGLEQGKQSDLWRAAKARPGGYAPEKLARLLQQVMPEEKYASYVGTDTGVLDRLSKQGYPIGATMNTGQLYRYMPIHHMISLVHYSKADGLACVVDNNDPGKYRWMPASEFDRRWIDGANGWAWIWTRLPIRALTDWLTAPVLLLAAAIVFLRRILDRESEPDHDGEPA